MTRPWRPLPELLQGQLTGEIDVSELATRVYTAVNRYVPFDFACLAVTDPVSGVVTWASKTRSLGVGDEEFAAAEYGPPDINSFAEIARRPALVGALSLDTGGRPGRCRRHRELMAPRFGFTDELRVVFPARGVVWGAMALYRAGDDPPFSRPDVAELAAVTGVVGTALARSLFRPAGVGGDGTGQAVLVVDAADRVVALTASAEAAVSELGGWDCGSLPAAMLTVMASARTAGGPAETVARTDGGRWLRLRAAALAGPGGTGDTVLTVDALPRGELSRLALAAHGLTLREEEVALLVLQGADTQAIAATLHLSPHTVQDHLKKIFAKVGVSSRRDLTARLHSG